MAWVTGGRNLEVKAHLRDRTRVLQALQAAGARDAGTELQHDVFYHSQRGRLKLRTSSRDGACLIAYGRTDAAAVRESEYTLTPLADPESARRALDLALGRAGEVRKERHLWRVDNVRVHLDRVEGLGEFLELEAVVDAEHGDAACRAACDALLERFGVLPSDHLATAYVDLLRDGDPPR